MRSCVGLVRSTPLSTTTCSFPCLPALSPATPQGNTRNRTTGMWEQVERTRTVASWRKLILDELHETRRCFRDETSVRVMLAPLVADGPCSALLVR